MTRLLQLLLAVASCLWPFPAPPPPDPRPPLADLYRFPGRELAEHQVAFLRARLSWLHDQESWDQTGALHEWFVAAQQDAQGRLDAWEYLRRAQTWASGRDPLDEDAWGQSATYSESQVRDYLRLLRDQLGARDYELGLMPLPLAPEYQRPIP